MSSQRTRFHAGLTLVVGATIFILVPDLWRALRAQPIEREMYVSVLDGNGAPVTDLTIADFLVREDGLTREVLRVMRATAPMQIAILVDNSQVTDPSIKDIRDGLVKFIDRMAGRNELAVVTFGERPTIAADYTRDGPPLKAAVGRLFAVPASGAYLLDAIVETTRGLRKREATRPVIVAILSEGPEFSNRHYLLVLESLRDSGAAFHALVIGAAAGSALDSDEIRNRNLVLDYGTRSTGGRRDHLLASMAVPQKLEEVAAELSNQYRVVYARPQSLIPPEKFEVSVKRPGLTARGTPVGGHK